MSSFSVIASMKTTCVCVCLGGCSFSFLGGGSVPPYFLSPPSPCCCLLPFSDDPALEQSRSKRKKERKVVCLGVFTFAFAPEFNFLMWECDEISLQTRERALAAFLRTLAAFLRESWS